jgi:hypothetical protein
MPLKNYSILIRKGMGDYFPTGYFMQLALHQCKMNLKNQHEYYNLSRYLVPKY